VKMPMFMTPDPIVIVKGKLIDAKTGNPIGAKIIYERLSDGKEVGVTYSNPETGEYEIHLPGGQQYGFRAEAKDHISENQNLDLRGFTKDGVTNKDITLAPIEVALVETNAKITLNNIFFDFDKYNLKPESFPELNRIIALMNERPTLEVEIAGHTDPVGTGEYNMLLSERRAKSVTRYLVSKGISEKRITTSYFGETRLIDTSNTPEGNRKNRRVEFKILKM
ncbi:MAG: OmpA family protein, partial [Cyclobacteriaceae bacterium]|nr:OmpA family protein [Cyclobacteriaceae bacterium]